MVTRPGRIGSAAAAHRKIARIVDQRLIDRRGPPRIGVLSARELLRLVGGLPERQHVRAVRVFLIVGEAKALDPVRAGAVCTANAPRTRSAVAPVADADAAGHADPIRLAL